MALTQEVEAEALYRQADKNDDKLWIYGGCVKDATDALGALYKYFLKRIKLSDALTKVKKLTIKAKKLKIISLNKCIYCSFIG